MKTLSRRIRAFYLTALLAAAGVFWACEEDVVGPGSSGSIEIRVVSADQGQSSVARAPSAPMGHLTGVTVAVTGPNTNRTQSLTATATGFTGTVDDLAPASYTVDLVGLVGAEIDHIGQQTGVQVQAGQNTTANITNWRTIVPTLDDFASPTTALTFPVTWNQITGATGYVVEWSANSDFSNLQTENVTTTSAAITVSDLGTVYVRVRSQITGLTNLRTSEVKSVQITTDITSSGDDLLTAPNLGFGSAANGRLSGLNIFPLGDFDLFRFDGCLGDEVRLEVYARRLTPPSALDPIVALFDGTGTLVDANDDIDTGEFDSRLIVVLPADGDFYPAVVAYNDETVGAYELEIEVTPGPNNQGTFCGRPDLTPTNITGDGNATAGDLMRVDLAIDNLGDATVPLGWVGHVVLSPDNLIDGSDRLLQTWVQDTDIGSGTSYGRILAAQVPDDVTAGTYYLGVILDVNDDLQELDEGNNVLASVTTVTIAAAPFRAHGSLSSLNLHTCRLDDTGAAKCWGDNLDGELGDGTLDNVSSTPVTVVGGLTFVQIVTGQFHTCGLTPDHDAYCWGWNGDGRLGNDPNDIGFQVTNPTAVSGGHKFVRITAGWGHTCGIALDGSAWCWGQGSSGELGDGTFSSSFTPIAVNTPPTFWKDIAAGDGYTCGIDNNAVDGTVYCWGLNNVGQLGNGSFSDAGSPVATTGTGLRDISIANWHACGTTSSGDAYCWGLGTQGQLGDGLFTSSPSKVLVSGTMSWLAIVSGGFHTCGVRSDGQVWCWGSAEFGQLGDGTLGGGVGGPTNSASGVLATQLALGTYHSCAKKTDGTYTCWGRNHFGQLGNGAPLTNTPRATSITGVAWVAAGWEHSCGNVSNEVWCWGANLAGALGDGGLSGAWSTTPVKTAGGIVNFDRPVSTQWAHTCAVNAAIDIFCWGFNSNGQIGDGTTTDRSSPVLVSDLGLTFVQVAGGNWHSCGLTDVGAAYCWGYNSRGQLGDNTVTESWTPVGPAGTFKLPGVATTQMTIATGQEHTCAIDANDDAWCWGANGSSQLGDGTNTDRLTPIQVQAGGRKFRMITTGDFHTCAVSTDATGWCWGLNNQGELGDGTFASSSLPVQITGGISWSMLSASNDITCGLDTGGNAYCWGLNFDGQLGDGTFWDSGEPSPVQTSLTFTSINAGNRHVCAVATDATVHCWGRNRYGQIGDGTQNVATTPVSVLTSAPPFAASRTYMAPTSSGGRTFDRSTFGRDPDIAEGQRGRTPPRR